MSWTDHAAALVRALPLLDLALVLLLALAAVHGWRAGAGVQVLRVAGALLGTAVGLALAHALLDDATSPAWAPVAAVLVGALVVGSLGARLGAALRGGLRVVGLGPLDAVLGAVVRTGLALVALWLVAGVVAAVGPSAVVAALARSQVVARLDATLPAPATAAGDVLGPHLAALVPAADASARVPSQARTRRIADGAAASTFKVLGTRCDVGVEGSAFAVDDDLVVTNAHVVRAATGVTVTAGGVARPATVVDYEPGVDLAVLRVDGLGARALHLHRGLVRPGRQAAVLGYPEDGVLTASPAAVTVRSPALTHADSAPGLRQLYRLRAVVRPGNSGGPLLDVRGRVLGVVTMRSLDDADVGWAVASPAVVAARNAAGSRTAAVDVGTCSAGG